MWSRSLSITRRPLLVLELRGPRSAHGLTWMAAVCCSICSPCATSESKSLLSSASLALALRTSSSARILATRSSCSLDHTASDTRKPSGQSVYAHTGRNGHMDRVMHRPRVIVLGMHSWSKSCKKDSVCSQPRTLLNVSVPACLLPAPAPYLHVERRDLRHRDLRGPPAPLAGLLHGMERVLVRRRPPGLVAVPPAALSSSSSSSLGHRLQHPHAEWPVSQARIHSVCNVEAARSRTRVHAGRLRPFLPEAVRLPPPSVFIQVSVCVSPLRPPRCSAPCCPGPETTADGASSPAG